MSRATASILKVATAPHLPCRPTGRCGLPFAPERAVVLREGGLRLLSRITLSAVVDGFDPTSEETNTDNQKITRPSRSRRKIGIPG